LPASRNARQMLRTAITNTDRVVQLTTAILDSARLESTHVTLARQVCAPPELICPASDPMSAMAEWSTFGRSRRAQAPKTDLECRLE
jgi:hypothetical protein